MNFLDVVTISSKNIMWSKTVPKHQPCSARFVSIILFYLNYVLNYLEEPDNDWLWIWFSLHSKVVKNQRSDQEPNAMNFNQIGNSEDTARQNNWAAPCAKVYGEQKCVCQKLHFNCCTHKLMILVYQVVSNN